MKAMREATMAEPKLAIRDVNKTFTRGGVSRQVLVDINLDIYEGQFVSIVGASGCGKTTLLRIIDGLIKASSGTVTHNGVPVNGPAKGLSYVFQQDGLLPWRTILRNVEFGPELRREKRAEYRERAMANLELVGLSGFFHHYPHELSGGMRQRANLARALTADGDTLLMDEPFAALDAQTRELMQAELLRIWRESGKTIIFVTHQIDEAVYLSDRVVVLSARPGRLKQVVDIDLERPRQLEVKRSPEFTAYTLEIWQMIEEEARTAAEIEANQQLEQRRPRQGGLHPSRWLARTRK
jgi:NitT/TauT family transport system ATP-binding protein